MRAEKQYLLDQIKDKIEATKALIVTKYQNFKSEDITKFRNELHELGGELEVVGKRVFIKAAKEAGSEFKRDDLQGHIALVFANDEYIDVAKAVQKFSENSNDAVEILGGNVEGVLYNAESMVKLSKLPSKDEMRAQIIGLFEAPMSQTLATFEALLTSVMHCIDNKIKNET